MVLSDVADAVTPVGPIVGLGADSDLACSMWRWYELAVMSGGWDRPEPVFESEMLLAA